VLTSTKVLNYVKDNLAFDFIQLELSDEKILDYIQKYTLNEFSQYFPDLNKIWINAKLDSNKVPGIQNEFYINDPEELEIIDVKDLYFSSGNLLLYGHPPLGPFSQGELRSWALDVNNSMMIKQFSSFDPSFEFRHPNVLRVSPVDANLTGFTCEYERVQPSDFRKIPNQFQINFCQMALSDIMILLGRIRKKYSDGNLRTPFGDIPISADIFQEGMDLKRDIVDKLINGSLPNLTIDFG